MTTSYFVSHPEVVIDPAVPVPDWGLSARGFERIGAFCRRDVLAGITDVFVSAERKALDCAEALRAARGVNFVVAPDLGENDRSATGYVAPPRFWALVDRFFAEPTLSVEGWERATDAQARVDAAVRRCLAARAGTGDAVFFSHGGVGTLLLCALSGRPITRALGQPIAGGGCFFAFENETLRLLHGWADVAAGAPDEGRAAPSHRCPVMSQSEIGP